MKFIMMVLITSCEPKRAFNTPGTVAMARTSDPQSANAQFFINVADNSRLNFREASPQGYGYTVFGKVVDGMDVDNKIAATPTGSGGQFYRATSTAWSESTVTWQTAPSADPALLTSLGPVSSGSWYEVDLTSLVVGDGTYSLRVSSSSSDGAHYASKERTGGVAPQLVVTTG